ncbi:hypothetical protein PGH07_03510 [Sulfurovum sp. zt1-1]|uniref:DUF11 domain-containing protein n=1 Tax=Sulfurovum zhangzhouensis TaxID=3019067 RepID=A0ABT7QWL6_9BACT|nr:DUF6701 domain-containing protein [Sulfurovum zhangzhouensis]MDM5271234.1 hypothetical protein [Sulfurovum zhangzhouensis]
MQYLAQTFKRFFFTLVSFRIVRQTIFSLFSSVLILFSGVLYAETEPNNSCITSDPILAFGIYTGSDIGSSSEGDRDYFSFDVPANGTLQVTVNNHTNKLLNYSALTSPLCPSSKVGYIGNNASKVFTIPSTLTGRYIIFLEGDSDNVANTYDISAVFTPNVPSVGNDLKVTKVANVQEALIYDPFYYTISVSNIGDQNVTDINLTDTLPDRMKANLDMINGLTTDWTCMDENNDTTGEVGGVITCTFDNVLRPGDVSIFNFHVRAPDKNGTIINTIEVNSSLPDVDPTNNIDTETTFITNEVGTAEHLCYTERTEILNSDYNASCEMKGNFYYGNDCEAYVLVREYNATTILSDIKVYKMYAPETKGGSCEYSATTSGGGSSGECNDITNVNDYGSYTEGYAVDINKNLVNNVQILLKDKKTYNTPRIDGIAMFGDYITELGFHHTGRIYECNGTSEGGVEITTKADLIDTPIDAGNALTYNMYTSDTDGSLKFIQTMTAGAPSRDVIGVHLSKEGVAIPYLTDTGIPYTIVPYMSNNTCSLALDNIIDPNSGQQLVIEVPSGFYSSQGQMIVPAEVSKISRMQLIFVDPNSLSIEGQNCLANSSTTGNFARLAQCVNSEVQYKTAFGQDAWDRCGMDGGKPCLSDNGGYADPGDPSFDPTTDGIYVNELGCYMCTFNIQPSCTTDNFAIRPDRMEIGMTDPDAPDLLRSAKPYSLSLTAKYPVDGIYPNGSSIPTSTVVSGYTVQSHNYNSDLDSDVIRYFKNGLPDTAGVLAGTSDVNITQLAFMVGGLSSLSPFGPTTTPGMPDESVSVKYTDVGTIELNIYDKEWAAIDNDDTPMDCNTSHAHTYICTYDQVTFIPDSFKVDNIVLRNHRDSNFTYLSNDLNMSAPTDVTISAINADGDVTQNFRQGSLFYENPVRVDLNVTEWNPALSNNHPLDNDLVIHDIPTEQLLGFGGDDANGTHNITWDESNTSQRLLFNYARDNNQPVNPFRVPESDVNISVASTYTSTTGNTAIITGNGVENDDRNATFYYGRAKSSQDFYDVEGTVATTPITMLVYCDQFPTCTFFPNTIQLTGQTDLSNWWLSLDHNVTLGDGNITLENPPTVALGSGTATVDTDVNIDTNAQDGTIQVVRTDSGSVSVTFDILLDVSTPTSTNSWVIYNADSPILPPDPFYKVRFTGESGWAGIGETGHVLDINASTTKTKRLNW